MPTPPGLGAPIAFQPIESAAIAQSLSLLLRQRRSQQEYFGPAVPIAVTTITTSLLASQCPAIMIPTTEYLLDAASVGDGNAPNAAPTLSQTTWRYDAANPNAFRLDMQSRIGGGIYACALGVDKIVLSAPTSGLQLQLTSGKAIGDGLVCMDNDSTLTLPDNTARVYIWLRQGQSPSYTYTTTTTAPDGNPIFLGSCITSGNAITNIDNSGVMYLMGGAGVRYTADSGAPTDTPSANVCFYTITAWCTYYWNGVTHNQTYIPSSASDPSTPQNGEYWYRTDLNKMKYRVSGSTVTGA